MSVCARNWISLASCQDSHFMVQERVKFEVAPALRPSKRYLPPGRQQAQVFPANAFRQPDPHAQRPDCDELMHRLTPGAGIGKVDEVENHPVRLVIEMAINQ